MGAAAFQGSKCKKGLPCPTVTDTPPWVGVKCVILGVTAHFVIIWEDLYKKKRGGWGVLLSQHVWLHLFWHMLCILLIQIPWHSDKSVTLFLGPDNQPCLLEGLACPRREIKKKKNPKSVMSVLSRFYKMTSLLCRVLFCSCYLVRFMLPWQI